MVSNAGSERMAAMDAAVKAVTDIGGAGLPEGAVKAIRAFADGEIRAATGPDRRASNFAAFVEKLGPSGVVSLSASTGFFSVRVNDAAIIASRGIAGGRELVVAMRAAHDAAVAAVATCWIQSVQHLDAVPPGLLDRIGGAMASLVGDGAALRGSQQQEAVTRFADALYPRAGSEEQHRAADAVVARIMALQSRGPGHTPFCEAIDALDFCAAVSRRRPGLDRLVEEAIRDDIAATTPVAPSLNGLPPRTRPRVRENSKEVRQIWSMDNGGGRSVCGRDPFDGPAATHRNLITGAGEQVYFWRGERLGPSRGMALENMRNEFPESFEACAGRFAAEMADLSVTDPAAHAEAVSRFRAEVDGTVLATMPGALLESLGVKGDPAIHGV